MQVGSNSHQGAGSLQLGDNLARITRSLFPDSPADAHQVSSSSFSRTKHHNRPHVRAGNGHTFLRGQHGYGTRYAAQPPLF